MDVFIYNREPLKPNRHYLIVDNYPLPITVEKGMYIKRSTVAIDVTGYDLDLQLDLDFDSLIKHYKLSGTLIYSAYGYASKLAQEPDIQQEANEYLDFFYRKE